MILTFKATGDFLEVDSYKSLLLNLAFKAESLAFDQSDIYNSEHILTCSP